MVRIGVVHNSCQHQLSRGAPNDSFLHFLISELRIKRQMEIKILIFLWIKVDLKGVITYGIMMNEVRMPLTRV